MASIRKRNGKWQVQVRRQGYKPVSRSFSKRADAEEWGRYKEYQADRRDLPCSTKEMKSYSVGDLLSRYSKEITPYKKSHAQEAITIRFLLKQKISKLSFDVLNQNHIADFRDTRLRTVQPATVVRELAIVQHALEIGRCDWGLPIKDNPVKQIKKPRINNVRNRRLKNGELELITECAVHTHNPYIMPMILFALETGMRRSEILAIQKSDIDFECKTLCIPMSKNGHSRTIPLSGIAINILQTQSNKEMDEPFPITANSFRLAWGRLIARTDIQDLHFHDLRHEAISRFFERGLSIPEVALISGHRDYRMLARYTHLKAEDIAKKL